MFFLYALLFILGTAVGSFLNVVVDRTTKSESVLFGRSYCDHCHAKLSSFDLIPIVSFVVLGARCRKCGGRISWQYPLVEGLTGLLFVLSFWVLSLSGQFSLVTLSYYLFIVSTLVVVATVDLKFYLIPTTLVFAASFVALFYNYFHLTSTDFVLYVFISFGLAMGFLLLLVATRGRGIGGGDVPLAFLIGLVLGWPNAIAAIFLAFFVGAVVSLLLVAFGKKSIKATIPFGPFLVFATIAVLFWGSTMISWYFSLL
ncbi:MAG: prepilin peptidase [Candidatus Curtissbacteria bacterium]|nr:prepilin peptidase [Candidatus Curtissbacteria bacterium]